MTVGGEGIKVLPQVLADCAGFRWRLDNYEIFRHILIYNLLRCLTAFRNKKPRTVPRFNYVLDG